MSIDLDFILALGKTLSLVVAMVFGEGIIASKQKGGKIGLILPVCMVALALAVYFIWKEWSYFWFVLLPTILCWAIYFACRWSVRNGTGIPDVLYEEENETL